MKIIFYTMKIWIMWSFYFLMILNQHNAWWTQLLSTKQYNHLIIESKPNRSHKPWDETECFRNEDSGGCALCNEFVSESCPEIFMHAKKSRRPENVCIFSRFYMFILNDSKCILPLWYDLFMLDDKFKSIIFIRTLSSSRGYNGGRFRVKS